MRIYAQQVIQPSGRPVFAFAATAETILQISDVPHIGRGDSGGLVGYQRPEIASHINEIRRYLESDDAVLANAVVVAFDERVQFEELQSTSISFWGELVIPEECSGERKPGFVVDGQQRLAALASCKHENFPFFVIAMIAPSVDEQRKQFVLVNRTRPLPQGMIYELLPEIAGVLPQNLAKQQLAASIVSRLNLTPDSILYHRIKSPTCPTGLIKDNSLRRAVLNSLSDGALLYALSTVRTRDESLDCMAQILRIYWQSVADVFPSAWNLPPKQSRLTHGVGVVAMGFVFDYIYINKPPEQAWSIDYVTDQLTKIVSKCAWTSGEWQFSSESRLWNSLQNVDRDIRVLSNYLIRVMKSTV